jgi:GT2 family glycosyltransferase
MWSAERKEISGNTMVCTVAISTCNSADYLRARLAQLLDQSLDGCFEVVVIDSGSCEDEKSVCAAYESKFPRLIYERTERETLYCAWNRALSKASGKYFVNANTDDSFHPDALKLFAEAMESHPAASLAYADSVWSPLSNADYPWPDSWKCVRYQPYRAETALFFCYTSCTQFWRTSSLRDLGGFDPAFRAVGDYEVLCRMVAQGMEAVHIPRVLSAFYQNPKGISQVSSSANDEFLGVRSRFRREVDLAKVFPVNMSDKVDRRGAHLTLALRSLKAHTPWHDEPVPDVDYAVENLLAAAVLSSSVRRGLIRLSASMVARGALGNAACHRAARMLLSPLGLFLLHGKPLAAEQ